MKRKQLGFDVGYKHFRVSATGMAMLYARLMRDYRRRLPDPTPPQKEGIE